MSRQIDWPAGWERTDPAERSVNNRFKKTLRESIDDLEAELGRVGVDNWRLSTGSEHQKKDPNIPYANASPDDPGAVVRWTMDGEQYAAACDRYTRLRDNIRSLFMYIKEKRKMADRPVVTGEDEFANARLPAGDQEGAELNMSDSDDARAVLGVTREATDSEIRTAFQERLIESHPDHGGSTPELTRVRRARDVLL